jgi:hypothetical protein
VNKGALALMTILLTTNSLWAKADKYNYEPKSPRVERSATATVSGTDLFAGAKVTAGGQWSTHSPDKAVDGDTSSGSHWACEGMPSWLSLELPEQTELGTIHLWPYWDNVRYYQYQIEGSLDGTVWTTLVDMSTNEQTETEAGRIFEFAPTSVRHVRVTFSNNSAGNERGGHIVELKGYAPGTVKMEQGWAALPEGLHGAVATLDQRYTKWDIPELDESIRALRLTGWRGERVAGQIVVWSGQPMHQLRATATDIAAVKPTVNPVRFVHGRHGADRLHADILDTAPEIDAEARTARSVWYAVDIPDDAKPGIHKGNLTVRAFGMEPVVVDVELDVIGMTLPPASEWSYHLDFWQHPWAIARGHNVEMFSEEFYTVARPLYRRLANAGQKCLTISINDWPWKQQTFDAYRTMIDWIKHPDGSWTYDYTKFDEYVAFGEACGIVGQINCYSMVPFRGYDFHYLDAATGDRQKVSAKPGTEAYAELWTPFLKDFARHLKKTGRLGKTCIAMDERPLQDLQEVIKLVKAEAPEMKIALAANHSLEEIADDTFDYCFYIGKAGSIDEHFTNPRRAKGQKTTFYVCCGPGRPNTFTFSPPAESVWLGWYAAERRFDGFLRWAYAHWNRNPLETTDYGPWPTGDCWLVYPGNRSSIRFERLREGIQDFEKLRIVRAALTQAGDTAAIEAIDKMLETFSSAPSPAKVIEDVNAAKALLNSLSRKLTK